MDEHKDELKILDWASNELVELSRSANRLGLSELAVTLRSIHREIESAYYEVKTKRKTQEASLSQAIAIAIQQSSIASFNATQQGLAQGLSQAELEAAVGEAIRPWQAIRTLLGDVLGVELEAEQPIGEPGWNIGADGFLHVNLIKGTYGKEGEPEQPIDEPGWTMGVPPDLEENTDIELLLHDGTVTEGMTWRHLWSSSSPEFWDACVISDCDQANSDGFLDTDLIKGWRLK